LRKRKKKKPRTTTTLLKLLLLLVTVKIPYSLWRRVGRWAAKGMASQPRIEGERDSPYIFRQEDFFNLFVHALEISSKDGGAPVCSPKIYFSRLSLY
jgi:hypothetical protein